MRSCTPGNKVIQLNVNQGMWSPRKHWLSCILESEWVNSLNMSFQGDAVTKKLM